MTKTTKAKTATANRKPAPKAKAKTTTAKRKPAAAKQTGKTTAPKSKTTTAAKPKAAPTRAYFAGVVLKKHGFANGITDAMVRELDKLYGKPSPRESRAMLRVGWNLCRGFAGLAEDAIE